ncbi:MAG: amino acid ABC transporter substrate-binding protein [Spirochaetales bacterium]|nr:amino acid ABC transporter substrate-binding protein [Leptospiraceae bacterium]MCP5479825.1 amino acid ABC transporter substrate-binding protein [Spirochaetales bacterium]MCP5486215.1 amino acid ABC transporter substrate-binding protein [Spirochaetales bacterium]
MRATCNRVLFQKVWRILPALLLACFLQDLLAQPVQLEVFPNAGPTIERIQSASAIRIGMQNNYQPFHIANPVEGYPGLDVEIAKALADAFGVELVLQYGTIGELTQMVQAGTVDLALGGVSARIDRARYVSFSVPYLITTPAALVSRRAIPRESQSDDFQRREYRNLGDLRFLSRQNIGVKAETSNEVLLRRNPIFRRHNILVYETRDQLLAALQEGDIDVLVADGVYIKALVLQHRELLSDHLALTEIFREEHLSILLPRGDSDFESFVNFVLRELRRTGRLQTIEDRYLNAADWVPEES